MNSSIDFGFNPAEVFKLKCEEEHTSAERLTAGHINYTYKVNFAGGKPIILQRVNTNVFRNIKGLMDNIFSVTRFLRGQIIEKGGDYRRGCLRFIKTRDGEHYYLDKEGHCWRAYYYVDNSYCTNTANTPLMFEKSGQAFGRFCMLLASFDGSSLHETIEDFHNTPVRYTQLLDAVARDIAGRKDEYVMPDIGFAREREEQYGRLVNLL
ncbi:MAG: hypothetical protein FWG82_02475, partial [Oscillospiraceae bacterium]|nr:hypothetical protein [Oscillospiraceae bacterium]